MNINIGNLQLKVKHNQNLMQKKLRFNTKYDENKVFIHTILCQFNN